MSYRTFFGLTREPFSSELNLHEILQAQELLAVKESFDYALRIGAMALVTGDIGSGKSTALRYAMGQLHPSEHATFYLTASSGSILELYRQILAETRPAIRRHLQSDPYKAHQEGNPGARVGKEDEGRPSHRRSLPPSPRCLPGTPHPYSV
jgi:type II secretory pathway predicted ATPase ExeA